MPVRLPTDQELGGMPVYRYERTPAVPDTSGLTSGVEKLGAGLANAGASIANGAAYLKSKTDATEETAAASHFLTNKPKIDESINDESDPAKIDGLKGRHADNLQSAAAMISDPEKRTAFIQRYSPMVANAEISANTKRFNLEKDAGVATFNELTALQHENGLKSSDPEFKKATVKLINDRIQTELVDKGYITETEAVAMRKRLEQGFAVKAIGLLPAPERAAALGSSIHATPELASAIKATATKYGLNPVDLATVISYETGGTFDPWKAGPTTQWGQHRGLIQWGEPQRKQYGITQGMPVADQLDAVGRYLVDRGVKPGDGILPIYAAINAGDATKVNATDENNGGAPGTVTDKVNNQMAGHRAKAKALLGGKGAEDALVGAIPFDHRQQMYEGAIREEMVGSREQQIAVTRERQTVNSLMSSDRNSIMEKGVPVSEITPERVEKSLGPDAARSFREDRALALFYHQQMRGIETVPESELSQRVERLAPQEGAANYDQQKWFYDHARKQAEAIVTKRQADPAQAVESHPAVKEARQSAQYIQTPTGKTISPDSAQAIIGARLKAQSELDLDPMPVTRGEARVIARELKGAQGDDDKIRSVMDALDRTYGQYAQQVLTATIQHQSVNKELAESAAEILGVIHKGQAPMMDAVKKFYALRDAADLETKLGVKPQERRPGAFGQAYQRKLQEQEAAMQSMRDAERPDAPNVMPQGEDVKALVEGGMTDLQFDAIYGKPGLAQRVRAEVRRRLAAPGVNAQ